MLKRQAHCNYVQIEFGHDAESRVTQAPQHSTQVQMTQNKMNSHTVKISMLINAFVKIVKCATNIVRN